MTEIIRVITTTGILPFWGVVTRLLLRSSLSNERKLLNMIRGLHIYLKFGVLLIALSNDIDLIFPEYKLFTTIITGYTFPLYYYLNQLKTEYTAFSDEGFFFILYMNGLFFLIAVALRVVYCFSEEKIKGLLYYYELLFPDLFIFIVKDYADLSPVLTYLQGCAILVTLSFWGVIGVIAPMIIVEQNYVYRELPCTKSGLKDQYRMW